jgi:hypothetical protein
MKDTQAPIKKKREIWHPRPSHLVEKENAQWIKQNGLRAENFSVDPHWLVQAEMIAANLLRHNSNLLGQNQADSLNNFLRQTKSSKRRDITQKQCYTVMNIGKQINRKLFKAHKAIKV